MEPYRFNNKRMLITGATGGLGVGLTLKLADMGARLILTARSETALSELRGRLGRDAEAVVLPADLSRPGEAADLARRAEAVFDGVDVLFNNAGVGYFALMEEATEENIRYLFELNTLSPIRLIQALLPGMKRRCEGRIINIISAGAKVPIPSAGVYGGSKAALSAMADTLRLELEPTRIEVVNIYPGTADTAFEENALRENQRPGLCPTDRCGAPRSEMAVEILDAAAGPSGEVWLERQGKFYSVAALLFPGLVDRRMAGLRDQAVKRERRKPRKWRLIQLESAIACNLRCVMCPWPEFARKVGNKGILQPEVWEALRPHLGKIQSIDFTGGGEPLMQPHLVEWIAEAHAAGCETGFLTNGTLLTPEKSAAAVEAGVDWVCVSIDGAKKETYETIRHGARFETVCDHIAALHGARKGAKPTIMINFVMMPDNVGELEDLVDLADRLGVDRINFKQCDVVRGEHGKGFALFASKETKEIRRMEKRLKAVRRQAKKKGIGTTAFAWTPDEQPVCVQDPTTNLFIRYDGTAAPCINLALGGPTTFLGESVTMPSVHYGKVQDVGLPEIWETEDCRFYRERFQKRMQAYEEAFTESYQEASMTKFREALESAHKAMPEAPEGCRVCHYLYNI